jgi:ribosomal protein S18 acetylase RimI-like enzyme
MYGYYINDQIVGCVGYSYYKDQIYFIKRLATLPEYRHKGIGKKLMGFVENIICENNGKIIEINVVDKNTKLIKWYKKLNYKYIRVDDLSGIEKEGKKLFPFNSYVMNKILE